MCPARTVGLIAGTPQQLDDAPSVMSLRIRMKSCVDPQTWLADVLARIADHPVSRLHELLPWHWSKLNQDGAAA